MYKIVLTHFEPFNGRVINASKEVLNHFKNQYDVISLPVSWEQVPDKIKEILKSNPDILILTGEAGNYKNIVIEQKAHNISNGKDVNGVIKNNEKISLNSPQILETNVKISRFCRLFGFDAGKYLCNYAYYTALENTKNTKVVFIHFPFIKEEGGEYLTKDLVKTFNEILDNIKEEN